LKIIAVILLIHALNSQPFGFPVLDSFVIGSVMS